MAYLKPPFFVQRIFNPLAMRFGIGGATTLSITGRRSGQRRGVPVIPVEHGGGRYLISTRGESEWVRNCALRAGLANCAGAGRRSLSSRPRYRRPNGRQIISAYRGAAGKTVDSYFSALPDPADHPVFRTESRRE